MQKIALFTVDGGTQLDCATFGSLPLLCVAFIGNSLPFIVDSKHNSDSSDVFMTQDYAVTIVLV